MRKIYLRNINQYALVDDADYDWVSEYPWYGFKSVKDTKHYVRAGVYQGTDAMGKRLYRVFHLQRLIADAVEGEAVTFRNRNALDCRRENLVIASRRQICHRAERRKGEIGYIGVYQDGSSGRYEARIRVNDTNTTIGYYATAERAALAYDLEARKHHGELARLNFPKVDAYSDLEESRIKYFAARKKNVSTSSKFLGVSKVESSGRWEAVIGHNGATYFLGCYSSEREAALAFDKKARELRGKDAILNFPKVTNYSGIVHRSGSIKPNRKTTSRFIGVCWIKAAKSWQATVTHDRKVYHCGYFKDEVEAAKARDAKALELRGDAAILNFPLPLYPTEQDYEQLKAPYCWGE